MILNRKSVKTTSRISLLVAVAMIVTIVTLVDGHGYQVERLADTSMAENGMQLCRMGAVELFASMLW